MINGRVVERTRKIEKIAKDNKVIIFGGGEITKYVLKIIKERPYKKNIVGIIDNNPDKVGSKIEGVTVYSLQFLQNSDALFIIINVQEKKDANEIYKLISNLDRKYKIVSLTLPSLHDVSKEVPYVIEVGKRTGKFPIIVYQMGKVGSATIRNSLGKSGLLAWHVHEIDSEFNKWKTENKYDGTFPNLLTGSVGDQSMKIKVVTLVRDPVARNMADFFQSIEQKYAHLLSQYRCGEIPVDNIIKTFFKNYYNSADYNRPLIWWQNELNAVFGIDVFQNKFPKEKGYKIYKNKNVEVLLIKLEKLNFCYKDAFKDFLGIQDFELCNSNIGKKKDYRDIYKAFKEEIIFPREFIDGLYNSSAVTHFYDEEEIKQFRRRLKVGLDSGRIIV